MNVWKKGRTECEAEPSLTALSPLRWETQRQKTAAILAPVSAWWSETSGRWSKTAKQKTTANQTNM